MLIDGVAFVPASFTTRLALPLATVPSPVQFNTGVGAVDVDAALVTAIETPENVSRVPLMFVVPESNCVGPSMLLAEPLRFSVPPPVFRNQAVLVDEVRLPVISRTVVPPAVISRFRAVGVA